MTGRQERLDLSEKLSGLTHTETYKGHLPIASMGICLIGDGQDRGQVPTMKTSLFANADKAAIRRRVEAELLAQGRDMKEVSLAAGLGATYVRDFLKRDRGKIENLIPVANELNKGVDWLLGTDDGKTYAIQAKTYAPNAIGREMPPAYGPPVPVLGAGRAGDDGKLIYNGQPLEWVPRPPELENEPDGYATYVAGTSMHPRFKEMEKVWVHPRRMPKSGDEVVVQLHPEIEGEPPEGYVKEFRRYTAAKLVLFQWNPECEIEIDRKRVISVHVIIGALYV